MPLKNFIERLRNGKVNAVTYLVEVSLIILSILVAIQADRYNQERKNAAKLNDYIQGIYQDLLNEQFKNENNLIDCQKDVEALQKCLRLLKKEQQDSLNLALLNLRSVFGRGVFRSFPPTTFDIMISTGDVALIKDLDIRNMLAASFSFRDTYVKKDLQDFDEETINVSRSLGKYFDLECMTKSNHLIPCLSDQKSFLDNARHELFIFLRTAQLRRFHLQIALNSFTQSIQVIEEVYEVEAPDVGDEGS